MKNDVKNALLNKKRYDFFDLVEIMRLLRAPDGCPWDREQTHKSIRNNFIEETYEAIEAIDNEDFSLMREELGDVMMQVVFHAVIAEEEGKFTTADVLHDVSAKLVHRHPHVFGDVVAKTGDEVLTNWEKIKSAEKTRLSATDKMKAVPPALPALMRADKLGAVAAKYGFDFPNAADAFGKVREEMTEVENAKTQEELFEEIGDLLFSVSNFARKSGISSEEALDAATKKFAHRFALMEQLMQENGVSFDGASADILEEYWQKSKKKG